MDFMHSNGVAALRTLIISTQLVAIDAACEQDNAYDQSGDPDEFERGLGLIGDHLLDSQPALSTAMSLLTRLHPFLESKDEGSRAVATTLLRVVVQHCAPLLNVTASHDANVFDLVMEALNLLHQRLEDEASRVRLPAIQGLAYTPVMVTSSSWLPFVSSLLPHCHEDLPDLAAATYNALTSLFVDHLVFLQSLVDSPLIWRQLEQIVQEGMYHARASIERDAFRLWASMLPFLLEEQQRKNSFDCRQRMAPIFVTLLLYLDADDADVRLTVSQTIQRVGEVASLSYAFISPISTHLLPLRGGHRGEYEAVVEAFVQGWTQLSDPLDWYIAEALSFLQGDRIGASSRIQGNAAVLLSYLWPFFAADNRSSSAQKEAIVQGT